MKNKFILILLLTVNSVSFAQNKQKKRLDSLEFLLQRTTEDTARLKLMQLIGSGYLTFEPVRAYKYYQMVVSYGNQKGNGKIISDGYSGIGNSWYYQGEYEKAKIFYLRAAEIAKNVPDTMRYATAINNIGLIYINQGNYSKGLEYQLISMRLREKINDKRGLALNYNAIGVIYYEQGRSYHLQEDLYNALDYQKKSLKVNEELKQDVGTISNLNNIGNIYTELKQYDRALDFMIRCLKKAEEAGNNKARANALGNIGSIFEAQGFHDKAILYLNQSISIQAEMGDVHGLANNYNNLADIYFDMGEYPIAKRNWEFALEHLMQTNDKGFLKNVYKGLANCYEKEGNFKNAYNYAMLYSVVTDSLASSEYLRNINEMKTRFDTESKQKEIFLLNKNNEILQKDKLLRDEQLSSQRNINIIISISLLIVGIFAFFIFKSYRDKHKANVLLGKQNDEIKEQKKTIEEKNKDITDSIKYAQRIQNAILPSAEKMHNSLADHFILYKPRDIVSGDFFWTEKIGDEIFFAVADCTGHGVPGALMSMIGSGFLNEIVLEKEIRDPEAILNHLREKIIAALEQKGAGEQKDGMDIAFCKLNRKTNMLEYSGANNPLWISRKREEDLTSGFPPPASLFELAPDKMPVGIYAGEERSFTKQSIQLNSGDMVYAFTDGYADQFGGTDGKKFKYKPLKQLIRDSSGLSTREQRKILEEKFEVWKGRLEQVDDVLILGIRI